MDVSNAATSVYAAESFVRTLPDVVALQHGFERARDKYHRVDETIYFYDDDTLRAISEGFNESMSNISEFFYDMTSYKAEYKKQLTTLHEAVKLLNGTVRMKYENFKQKSHVAFYSLDNTLKTTMMEIVAKAQLREDFPYMSAEKVNETLQDIDKKLALLVVSKDHGFWVKKSILSEMTDGIEKFRDDLLLGYGQMYSEFKETREFYDNLTNTILRTARLLTAKLKENYDRVKELTRLSDLKDQKVVNTLEEVANEINTAADVTLEELVLDLDRLFKMYTIQKDQILNLVDKLVDIGGYFNSTVGRIQDLLSSLGTLVASLRGKIQALKQEIVTLRQEYKEKSIEKSELARSFNKETLSGLIEATKVRDERTKLWHQSIADHNRICMQRKELSQS